MGEQNRGTNFVEQGCACIAIELLLAGKTGEGGKILRQGLIKDRIAKLPASGKLRVQMRLRPEARAGWRGELALHTLRGMAR